MRPWFSGTRHIPTGESGKGKRAIDEIVSAYHPSESGQTPEGEDFKTRLEVAIKADTEKDILTDFTEYLKSKLVGQLVYPPFVQEEKSLGFLDHITARFLRFSGMPVRKTEDLIGLMEDLRAKRLHAAVGVFSSLDRLTRFTALSTPIRVGINAVLREEDLATFQVRTGLGRAGAIEALQNLITRKHETRFSDLVCAVTLPGEVADVYVKSSGSIRRFERVGQLVPDLFGRELRNLSAQGAGRCCPIAIIDELTCLRVVRYLATEDADSQRTGNLLADDPSALLFPLADRSSVQVVKKELPEFHMSILLNREDAAVAGFFAEAMWQFLQTDLQLVSSQYVKLRNDLVVLAISSLKYLKVDTDSRSLQQRAEAWSDYTLRLDPKLLGLYESRDLPWRPILIQAVELLSEPSGDGRSCMSVVETAKAG